MILPMKEAKSTVATIRILRKPLFDHTGLTYGKWVVIGPNIPWNGYAPKWLCRCGCGTIKSVFSGSLIAGTSKSCGCGVNHYSFKNKEEKAIYHVWRSMRKRCVNPKAKNFRYYGARGITICERWEKFENFLSDMGDRPKGTSLERIDNDGGYCPANCKWATTEEQNRNKSNKRLITLDGLTLNVSDWGRRINGNPSLVFGRLKNGWDERRAVTVPARQISIPRAKR